MRAGFSTRSIASSSAISSRRQAERRRAPPRRRSPRRSGDAVDAAARPRPSEPRVELARRTRRRRRAAAGTPPRAASSAGELVAADLLEEERIASPGPAAPSRRSRARASYGVSPAATIRCSRCSMMPEIGVHHRRERGDRDHVARGLDRLLLGLPLDRLQPLGARARRDVAQLLQDRERIVLEQRRELRVAVPGRERPRARRPRSASPVIGGTKARGSFSLT